jgi:uncharacterized protein YjbI with pentapeptide repeats
MSSAQLDRLVNALGGTGLGGSTTLGGTTLGGTTLGGTTLGGTTLGGTTLGGTTLGGTRRASEIRGCTADSLRFRDVKVALPIGLSVGYSSFL